MQRKLLNQMGRSKNRKIVYRGTSTPDGNHSHPDNLKKQGGFHSKGNNTSIKEHRTFGQVGEPSTYVSTTTKERVAAYFAGNSGWIHLLQIPEIYANIKKIYDEAGLAEPDFNHELAAIKTIPYTDIIASHPVASVSPHPIIPLYRLIGSPIINEKYQVRNYSCQILSVNEQEVIDLENGDYDIMQDLPMYYLENVRAVRLHEAQHLCGALAELSKTYDLNASSPHFEVESLDNDKPFNIQAMEICNNYQKLMAASNVTRKLSVIHFDTHTNLFSNKKNDPTISQNELQENNKKESSNKHKL